MTILRLVTPWLVAAAVLVGLGSDPGAEDRAPVSDDPVTRIESGLPISPEDKMGDEPGSAHRFLPGPSRSHNIPLDPPTAGAPAVVCPRAVHAA
jgi:hypothetical protein